MKLNTKIISYIIIIVLVLIIVILYYKHKQEIKKLNDLSLQRITELNKSQQEIIELQTKINLLTTKKVELDSVISLKDKQLKIQQSKFDEKLTNYYTTPIDKNNNQIMYINNPLNEQQRDTLRAKYLSPNSRN